MLSDPRKKKIYDAYGEEGLKCVAWRVLWLLIDVFDFYEMSIRYVGGGARVRDDLAWRVCGCINLIIVYCVCVCVHSSSAWPDVCRVCMYIDVF